MCRTPDPQWKTVERNECHHPTRVLSLPRTVECAEKIVSATLDTYFARNKTIRELYELMKSGAAIDPLKDFSEAAGEV